MTRARIGTLFAGLAGVLLLLSTTMTSTVLLPEVWAITTGALSIPENYLQFVSDNSTFFRLTHFGLAGGMIVMILLIFHLRPDAEKEAQGGEETPLPWLVLVGMAGALIMAAVASFDLFSTPSLARVAASGSQTAVADWENQVGLWTRWLPALGWLLFSIWFLWQTPSWDSWRLQLSRLIGRYGVLLAVVVAALPLDQRQTGREFVIEAFYWLLLGLWSLSVANRFWRQELVAVYGDDA